MERVDLERGLDRALEKENGARLKANKTRGDGSRQIPIRPIIDPIIENPQRVLVSFRFASIPQPVPTTPGAGLALFSGPIANTL